MGDYEDFLEDDDNQIFQDDNIYEQELDLVSERIYDVNESRVGAGQYDGQLLTTMDKFLSKKIATPEEQFIENIRSYMLNSQDLFETAFRRLTEISYKIPRIKTLNYEASLCGMYSISSINNSPDPKLIDDIYNKYVKSNETKRYLNKFVILRYAIFLSNVIKDKI